MRLGDPGLESVAGSIVKKYNNNSNNSNTNNINNTNNNNNARRRRAQRAMSKGGEETITVVTLSKIKIIYLELFPIDRGQRARVRNF